MRTIQHEGFEDNDDARGFEDVSCDPSTVSNYDDDKIQKRPYRWFTINIKIGVNKLLNKIIFISNFWHDDDDDDAELYMKCFINSQNND